jgi:hypothetical protein
MSQFVTQQRVIASFFFHCNTLRISTVDLSFVPELFLSVISLTGGMFHRDQVQYHRTTAVKHQIQNCLKPWSTWSQLAVIFKNRKRTQIMKIFIKSADIFIKTTLIFLRVVIIKLILRDAKISSLVLNRTHSSGGQ